LFAAGGVVVDQPVIEVLRTLDGKKTRERATADTVLKTGDTVAVRRRYF
jgi:hypothetical protein